MKYFESKFHFCEIIGASSRVLFQKMLNIAVGFILIRFCCGAFSVKNVEIISSLPYNVTFGASTNIGSDIISTGAAFDLAAEHANRKYRSALNVSMKYLFSGSPPSCDDVSSKAVQKYAEYYYKNVKRDTCHAIVISGNKFTKFNHLKHGSSQT
jgi:hypothetical protein